MAADDKATGWKIPLLFCACIVAIVGVGWLFIPKEELPPLPAALLAQAKETKIDISGPWREKIASAASGFRDQNAKAADLAKLIDSALSRSMYDAACAASLHLVKSEAKDAVLEKILDHALADCQTLVWGVFAIREASAANARTRMADRLGRRWQSCQAEKP